MGVPAGELLLVRHGETAWSRASRHTGRTDVPLTETGREQAARLAPLLADRPLGLVLTSPLRRAAETAALAGLAGAVAEPDLQEWDYGEYDGITTADILRDRPDWVLWRDGCPGGESPADVGARVDRVLVRARAALADAPERDVVLVAHAHSLRVLTARWLGLPPSDGSLLRLDTATLSALGFEHGRPVVLRWNLAA